MGPLTRGCFFKQLENLWIDRFSTFLSLPLSLSSEKRKERKETGRAAENTHVEKTANSVEEMVQPVEYEKLRTRRSPWRNLAEQGNKGTNPRVSESACASSF